MRKTRLTICIGILLLAISSLSGWTFEFERIAIRVPEKISRELRRYNENRRIFWVGVNQVLYSSDWYTDQWESMIFDIRTGETLREFEGVPYRVDRLNSQILFRNEDTSMRVVPFDRDPEDFNPPLPVTLEHVRKGAMWGQSTFMIQQRLSDGSVVEGEWYNERETMRELGVIGDLGPVKILDTSTDGRALLFGPGSKYIARIENLRIVDLSKIETERGLSQGSAFFVNESSFLATTINLERKPLGGADGPGVEYLVLLDFKGGIIAEYKSIEKPSSPVGGHFSYDPVMKRLVILKLMDDDFASTEVAVYRIVDRTSCHRIE